MPYSHSPRPNILLITTNQQRSDSLSCYGSTGELVDLENDPQEQVNLWDDPACAPLKASLLARLLDTTERLERRVSRDCYA